MAGSDERPPIEEFEDPAKTPPAPMRGRSALRAFGIVMFFVVVGSALMVIGQETGVGLLIIWTDDLRVHGLVVGLVVAAGDYLWRRRRRGRP